jgi:subtilase family serine protease
MGRYALIGGLVACAIGAPVAGCGTNGGSAAKSTASGNGSTQSPSKVLPNGAVRIERNAHPIARPELDLGPVDPSTRMSQLSIAFKPTAAQTRDLEQLKKDLQNPGSPSYHKWLTPEDYAARFGANPADVARVRKWLGDQGLEVGATSRLNSRVTFAGSAGKVGAAFQTEYHHYKVGNETHFAMSKAPAVPAEFADLILDIHNTHDLRKRPLAQPAHPIPESTCPGGTVKSYCAGPGIAPPDWASIYDVSKLYTTGVGGKALDGTGVTIAIVGTA